MFETVNELADCKINSKIRFLMQRMTIYPKLISRLQIINKKIKWVMKWYKSSSGNSQKDEQISTTNYEVGNLQFSMMTWSGKRMRKLKSETIYNDSALRSIYTSFTKNCFTWDCSWLHEYHKLCSCWVPECRHHAADGACFTTVWPPLISAYEIRAKWKSL